MSGPRELEVDYAVIGTGAGGATAARVLSEAGRSLVLLEEGPALPTATRPRAVSEAMRESFRDGGTLATYGRTPMPILQGVLVGGSTAINSGIIWRLPADVKRVWTDEHGLGELVQPALITPIFERLERELAIGETPAPVLGHNAALMARAAERLALPGRVIERNVRDCVGSARCLQGCPRAARQSMDVSYVPYAVARGATLWPLARADHLDIEGGRAVGVRGCMLDPTSRRPVGRFRVRARRGVIVAAGALHTPLLLRRAGLKGLVGQRFQAHPGAAVLGRFDERVVQGFGATQAYEVPLRERGYKLESLTLPPELLAARMPGVGPAFQERLAALAHYAHWVSQVRMRAHGSVLPGWTGRPIVRFTPLPEDMARMRESIALLVRMFFAAGAREVSPGIHGLPAIMTSPAEAELIERATLTPDKLHLLASHLFGTACAGADPQRSVVGPNLESHHVRNLYVMDASVFPTNLGVNPQHSIMAVVYRAASLLA